MRRRWDGNCASWRWGCGWRSCSRPRYGRPRPRGRWLWTCSPPGSERRPTTSSAASRSPSPCGSWRRSQGCRVGLRFGALSSVDQSGWLRTSRSGVRVPQGALFGNVESSRRCFLVAAERVAVRGRRMEPAHRRSVVRGKDGLASHLFAHPTLGRTVGRLLPAFRWTEDPILAADAFHSACLSVVDLLIRGAGREDLPMPPVGYPTRGCGVARSINDNTRRSRPA